MSSGVSIIIDSYNHERFVGAAIESALSQDHHLVQVIVIDDGSPDRSQEIIKGFGDRIQSVFQENQGQVAACRNALALAEHDIVIFLDSDDLLDSKAASIITALWRKDVVKAQYCLRVIDENGAFAGDVFPKYSGDMTPETVRAEVFRTGSYTDSPTSGNAYDRRFLEVALPQLPSRNGFDGELNGIAPLYGDVITIVEPLGSYRIHGSNVFAQSRLVIEKFENYLRHNEARVAFVRNHYRSRGHVIEPDVLNHDLKYLEYRLVVEKLGKDGADRSRQLWKVAGLLIRAAWQSPHALSQKLVRIGWAATVALAPRNLAVFLVEQRFIPGQRWSWITRLTAIKPGSPAKASNPLRTRQELDHANTFSPNV